MISGCLPFYVAALVLLLSSCSNLVTVVCLLVIFSCSPSCSRNADQMCRVESRVHLSEEEEIAAEESLLLYCKPVELYNILQRRAIRNVTS